MTKNQSQPDTHQMLIAGHWVDALDGQVIEVENPGRRSVFATVPRAQQADLENAVDAAHKAFQSFRKIASRDRGKLLLDVAVALESDLETMAHTIAQETGNAIRTQARPEAAAAADIFRYFGGLGSELKGEQIPLNENMLSYSRREPIGVVGAIIPWNAPVLLAALKIAPALCAGNTMVLKAAEDAPLGVLLLARVCNEKLPAGVLNVLTGYGDECGAALSQHPSVRKVSFTGSTDVGKAIMRAASERVAPVSLELGGKSPSIVFPDANEDWVLDGIVSAMRFTRQSQSCTAGSRLFLHTDIFDEFLAKLAVRVEALKIGDPLDESTEMGAIINEKQFKRVCSYIDEGLSLPDAHLITGGMPDTEGPLSKGYFTKPTIFAEADNNWRLAREEIFGPVLMAIRWSDEQEVIDMANNSHYGLAAFVWSRDIGQALRTAHNVEAGWVQINQGIGQLLGQSYGGVKQSGIGREYSLESMLDSFTQKKSVTVNLNIPPPL